MERKHVLLHDLGKKDERGLQLKGRRRRERGAGRKNASPFSSIKAKLKRRKKGQEMDVLWEEYSCDVRYRASAESQDQQQNVGKGRRHERGKKQKNPRTSKLRPGSGEVAGVQRTLGRGGKVFRARTSPYKAPDDHHQTRKGVGLSAWQKEGGVIEGNREDSFWTGGGGGPHKTDGEEPSVSFIALKALSEE